MIAAPLSPTDFQLATEKLINAKKRYTDAAVVLASAKSNLEIARGLIIRGGLAGKNAEERDANLQLAVSSQTTALESAEKTALLARHEMEVAQLELDNLRYHLRLLEVLKGVGA